MKRTFFVIMYLLLISAKGICIDGIVFNYDYSVFKGENGKSILEVYYSVSQQSLKYIRTENNTFEAGALIEITITDAADNNVVFSNIYKSPSVVTDTSKNSLSQKLVGQVNYSIDKGKYRLTIQGSDFNDTTRKDLFEQELVINNEKSGKVKISDIELSSSIRKSDNTASPFYKNTLEIIPNPSGLYGMNLNELHYYYEIYGLTDNNISENYTVNYSVNDLNNVNLKSISKEFKRKMESKADYGKIIIDSLSRGSYMLRITISDSVKNVQEFAEKKFYIFNTNTTPVLSSDQTDYLKSEFVSESEEQLDDDSKKMIYIMGTAELSKYKSLTSLNDKRKFMYEFWKTKDINPVTNILETKIAYFKRVDEANKNYKEAYTEGWKTDRGRIFIIYGKPDDVERYPFETQTKNYEIWKYNSVEGGGECAFVEVQTSTGVYDLVHCTFRNELKNSNWKALLNKY